MSSYQIHPETQYVEFSDLFKENRVWRIYVRLIKKASQQTFTQVDWNLMEEVQVPILDKYLQGEHIPNDLVAELWTETGLVTGKITRSIPTYAPEKNQGKKNYRDSFQQALSMAQSKYDKKLKEGFSFVQSSDCVAHSDTDPKIFPMLAKPYKKGISYPVYTQPKLDGLRCVTFYDSKSKQVVMQSRTRKVFPDNASNDLIRQQLQPILQTLPPLTYLDGELYNHSVKLQDLNHFARGTETAETPTLEYHVYDILYAPYTHTFEERAQQLTMLKSLVQKTMIKVVDTQFIPDEKQLDKLYSKYIDQGYEGLMVRNPNGVYEFGKRSGNLLKRKEVFTEEFPIVDYTSGTKGKDLNALIWICETPKGDRFKVTPNLTYEERYDLFKQAQKKFDKLFKNRLLTVEYRNLSVDQVPQHAKAVVIRDVE
jgi:DNA ligase-1